MVTGLSFLIRSYINGKQSYIYSFHPDAAYACTRQYLRATTKGFSIQQTDCCKKKNLPKYFFPGASREPNPEILPLFFTG
jgi:hypothetical protein